MSLTSMYFGMLFTNWGDALIGGKNDEYFSSQTYTMWAKIVSLWVTIALFAISISLNICCKNR